MSILYKKVVRPSDPTNKDSAKKVYPVTTYRYTTPATLKEFSKKLSAHAGVSEGTVYCVLKDFRALLRDTLVGGRSVNISGLGYFYLSLQSKGTEKAEEFTMNDISGLRVCFRANNDIRVNNGTAATRTDGLKFKDVDRVDALAPEDGDDDGEKDPIDPMA